MVMFLSIDLVLAMAKPKTKLKPKVEDLIKQKHNQSVKANGTSKYAKKSWASSFFLILALSQSKTKVPSLFDLL